MSIEKIVDDLIAAIVSRDAKAVGNMFAEDCVFAEIVGTGSIVYGKKATCELWEKFFNDNSKDTANNKWDIQRKIINGNNAAVERISHFVFKDKKIVLEMVAIIEVDDNGKIKAFKDYGDSRAFIEQTGNEQGGKDGW